MNKQAEFKVSFWPMLMTNMIPHNVNADLIKKKKKNVSASSQTGDVIIGRETK